MNQVIQMTKMILILRHKVTPRSVIPDFSIDRLYEEEQPDATDMPDLESQESAVQRRNQ